MNHHLWCWHGCTEKNSLNPPVLSLGGNVSIPLYFSCGANCERLLAHVYRRAQLAAFGRFGGFTCLLKKATLAWYNYNDLNHFDIELKSKEEVRLLKFPPNKPDFSKLFRTLVDRSICSYICNYISNNEWMTIFEAYKQCQKFLNKVSKTASFVPFWLLMLHQNPCYL